MASSFTAATGTGHDAGRLPLWTVSAQELRPTFNANGDVGEQWRVHFTTRSGIVAHVDIPIDAYDAPTVATAIDAYARQIESVHALQGDAGA